MAKHLIIFLFIKFKAKKQNPNDAQKREEQTRNVIFLSRRRWQFPSSLRKVPDIFLNADLGSANNTLILFYIFLLKLLSALLVTNLLLSAGGQDSKIPPTQETPRNQSDNMILFILPARVPKKLKVFIHNTKVIG